MDVSHYAVVPVRSRENNELVADICAKNSFWGWLSARELSKADWEFIGKQMGWIK